MKKVNISYVRKVFGKNLKYYRFKKNLTQEQLAELLNVDSTYISEMERGRKGARFDTLAKLSNHLNVSVSQLFDEDILNKKIPDNIKNFNSTN